ncbi:hypothetical protein EYF80_002056 [Liparis tanakae]|uniref:Uncharacterized protein n=1 Tax=Liparis tanakae TaxID=230148 RepID=A0A4Z2JBV7_9TELE|nr:hypothetical protein EYF80_002056 [Liparis tanakae]
MFLPILFSTTHSYPPVSSCWKLGISSTALEYFILTLLGKGTPLALFQKWSMVQWKFKDTASNRRSSKGKARHPK